MNTIASRDQFKPIRIGEDLVANQMCVTFTNGSERGLIFNGFASQLRLETLLHGAFVKAWWKENLRISRRTFKYIVRVAGTDLAYSFAMNEIDAI